MVRTALILGAGIGGQFGQLASDEF